MLRAQQLAGGEPGRRPHCGRVTGCPAAFPSIPGNRLPASARPPELTRVAGYLRAYSPAPQLAAAPRRRPPQRARRLAAVSVALAVEAWAGPSTATAPRRTRRRARGRPAVGSTSRLRDPRPRRRHGAWVAGQVRAGAPSPGVCDPLPWWRCPSPSAAIPAGNLLLVLETWPSGDPLGSAVVGRGDGRRPQ